jgi:hypothetical protein
MELPIYKLQIKDDEQAVSGVEFTALVDAPAIERNFLAFNKQQSFEVVSEEQRIISGPMMLADVPIYRDNQEYGKHYIVFDAPTIKQIAIKFSKKGFQNNVNLMHDSNLTMEGVTMFESFITDSNRGILPMKGFEDVPNGSWFGSFYVENDDVWNAIKEGKLKGFSVEGMFIYDEPKQTEQDILNTIQKLLSKIN